ncbi:MAG: type II toxin-antitoxin system VapC family toxin [Candidatus Dormibacteria bacterium]
MTAVRPAYFDSSFLIAAVEPEDRRHVNARSVVASSSVRITSIVAELEVLRALGRRGAASTVVNDAHEMLSAFALVELTHDIRARAVEMRPTVLRSLDAIHLATALVGAADEFHTFDERQRVAAEELGLSVVPA